MDTGDALGDMYFDLRSLDLPIGCAHPSKKDAKDCGNPEVTSNNLVYLKSIFTPIKSSVFLWFRAADQQVDY